MPNDGHAELSSSLVTKRNEQAQLRVTAPVGSGRSRGNVNPRLSIINGGLLTTYSVVRDRVAREVSGQSRVGSVPVK
jgi:hypothetical protein